MGTADLARVVEEFEAGLDPTHPERHSLPSRVLGYGEMSTVLAVDVPPLDTWACKRMAVFESEEECGTYERLLGRYTDVLGSRGLVTPDQRVVRTTSPRTGRPVLYLLQRRLDPGLFGNSVVRTLTPEPAACLVTRVLRESAKVWTDHAEDVVVGLDAQISNWVVSTASEDTDWSGVDLLYIDTGTPLMREGGDELLDPELFLRLCPASLRWVVRRLFLQDVLDRYYDFRAVAVDLVANLVKEGRDDLVPAAAHAAAEVVRDVTGSSTDRIATKEVHAYYREDKMIWRLFLGLRRLERFVTATCLRRPYDVVLPGRIRR
ncbi:MAG: hypothetical protein IT198_11445 [Acidimicrobiia bacterium]|nr:hypothetical protein [Acidimicrobiia bacterium]